MDQLFGLQHRKEPHDPVEQSPIVQWIQQQLEHNKREQLADDLPLAVHRGRRL